MVRSDVFASRRWSAAVGAAAVWLVLFRLVAVGHLAAVAAVLLPVLAARLAWRSRPGRAARRAAWQASASPGPSRPPSACRSSGRCEAIKNYYVVGHVTGEERAIRLQMFLRGGGNLSLTTRQRF